MFNQTFTNDREDENIRIKDEYKSLVKKKDLIYQNLKLIKEEKAKYIIELTAIRNELFVHYHRLLNEGKDTRNEGLSWIIKAIWNLEYNVLISYLPNFTILISGYDS